MSVIISNVLISSPASKALIVENDKLISINGNKINDVLDYMFFSCNKELELAIKSKDDIKRIVKISKKEYEDLGLCFEDYLMDKQKHCQNKCIFCFIDQLPKGLRKTLYFKDDDIRLSFLMGNYISLTNLNEQDIRRIIKLKISPINISVHTTNTTLRKKMMNNDNATSINDIMKRFAFACIEMKCQIVVCKGINDKDELKKTLNDLFSFYPFVSSVSVVPVGLTKYREGLFPLSPLNIDDAKEIIKITETFSNKCFEKTRTRFAFIADELFLKANQPIPDYEYYEEYSQLENGVGLMALFQEEFLNSYIKKKENDKTNHISIVTGVSAYPLIKKLVAKACEKWHNLHCEVYPIVNNFFGETVNVAGLITGNDLIEQLKDKPLGDKLLIPSVMLRYEKDMFLDNVTIDKIESKLNAKVKIIDIDGKDFLNNLIM